MRATCLLFLVLFCNTSCVELQTGKISILWRKGVGIPRKMRFYVNQTFVLGFISSLLLAIVMNEISGSLMSNYCHAPIAWDWASLCTIQFLYFLWFFVYVHSESCLWYLQDLVLRNLDYMLTISPSIYAQLPPALLAELEKVLDSSSSEPWSQRLLPTPSATLPVVIDSEEEDGDTCGDSRIRNLRVGSGELNLIGEKTSSEGFLLSRDTGGDDAVGKQLRAVRKKLQQIEALELKQLKGHDLDSQQLAKLLSKPALEISLSFLESGVLPPAIAVSKVSSSPAEKEVKQALGKADNTTISKHGGRFGRRKGKGSTGRGQSVDPPAAVKLQEANRDEDFDLQVF